MRVPEAVAPLLERLAQGLPSLLGDDLFGLYLYGGVLDPAFDLAGGDVDCILVTEQPLDDDAIGTLDRWLAEAAAEDPWVPRLQMTILIRDTVLEEDRRACLYQLGALSRAGSDGNPIIWLDHLRRGVTPLGPPAEAWLPKISAETLHRALVRELHYLREELWQKPESEWRDVVYYRRYATLTMYRILYTHATGAIGSKAEAGRWALERVPAEHHALIGRALEHRGSNDVAAFPLPELRALLDLVQERLDQPPR